MLTIAPEPDRKASGSAARRGWALGLLLVILWTILIRAHYFGNPLVDADEEFYLLTGDRLLHGALPYVDIWDRKPVGLFLLFAAIRLLGGNGVLAYQLVATGFAAATAILIAIMARRIAPPRAAIVAALAYAPAIGLSGGQGGQTPVFYNLLVAAAAWLILRRAAPRAEDAGPVLSIRWLGVAVMLLIGVAIQIKYNAMFEGFYFGLALLWLGRHAGLPLARLLDALLWIGAALLPTLAATLGYLAIGHSSEFVYANFGSIFARAGIGRAEAFHNLGHDVLRILPLLAMVLIAEWLMRPHAAWRERPAGTRAHSFLIGWLVAAAIGFLLFGTYFNHYALPLLPPLVIAAAPAFAIGERRVGVVLSAFVLAGLVLWYHGAALRNDRRKGDAAYAYALADRIRPTLSDGRCLFVFYGEPIFYQLTDSCLLTRWPFPYHLSLTREAPALGIDPAAETRRILARKPAAVLTKDTPDPEMNRAIQGILLEALHRDYQLDYSHRLGGRDPETDQLWIRRPGR